MIFLFGERVYSKAETIGAKPCAVCDKSQKFSHVVETNYFCLFGVRLLPIEHFANYWRCEHCQSAYLEGDTKIPSHIHLLRMVISYIQVGYGLGDHPEVAEDICLKVSGFEFPEIMQRQVSDTANKANADIRSQLQEAAVGLNLKGKQEILEAAFLMTYASCEIQHEDRVRVNLLGNALGVSLEFVNAVVDRVHSHACYGVRRLLANHSHIS